MASCFRVIKGTNILRYLKVFQTQVLAQICIYAIFFLNRDITTTNTRQIHLDASGVVNINSSAGVISIGNDDIDQNINIGTDGTRTVTIGEAADSTLTLNSKGGTFTLDGTGQTVDLNSSALDIDATGAVTIDSTSTFSIDGVGSSNVTTVGTLTLSGSTQTLLKSEADTKSPVVHTLKPLGIFILH